MNRFTRENIYAMFQENHSKELVILDLYNLIETDKPIMIDGTSCFSKNEIEECLERLGY